MHKLYKVSCQRRHLVFRFLGVAAAASAPATPPSPGSSGTVHGVSHGGVLQLHQVLEDGVAEYTAAVLGLSIRERAARFVEVHGHH